MVYHSSLYFSSFPICSVRVSQFSSSVLNMWFVVPPIKNVQVYVWNRFGGILKDSIACPLNGFAGLLEML